MGTLVNFISHSVVIGFTSGAALLIASNQLNHFFGINIPRGSDFLQTMMIFGRQLTQINPYILSVSGITLLVGIFFRSWLPRIPYILGKWPLLGADFFQGTQEWHVDDKSQKPKAQNTLGFCRCARLG